MGLAAFNNYRRQRAAQKAAQTPSKPAPQPEPQKSAEAAPVAPANDMAALRAEYERVVGKRPWMGWDAGELRRRMAEHAEAPAS